MLKIFSWNVNGVRAVLAKGVLQKFLEECKPDILCLQEIKAKPEQVDYDFPGYQVFWNPAERPGYSGTATLVSSADLDALDVIRWASGKDYPSGNFLGAVRNIRLERPNLELYASETSVAVPEGRILTLEFPDFFLVNVYVPNSKRGLERLELREKEWDPGLLQILKELEKTKPVVVCGDFNAAHEEIDLARPKQNHHNAGFTDEERRGVDNLIKSGFIDTFRTFHPEEQRYTWWSHWGHARENNVGWRIDYFFVSKSLKPKLKDAEIHENVTGSDHCPVSVTLEIGNSETEGPLKNADLAENSR